MPRILIVEDQATLLATLARGLREESYEVVTALSAAAATAAISATIDVVLLDLALPDDDGLTWLRQQRAGGLTAPVIIVTARDAVDDRITGLDTGADDYLVKPIEFNELLARLRAVLRRSSVGQSTVLRVEDLEADLIKRRVTRAGLTIELTQRQFELLTYLMQHAKSTVDRERLARDVWKEQTATWTNVIEVQINQLRKRIERPEWIPLLHTIRGEGYWLGVRP